MEHSVNHCQGKQHQRTQRELSHHKQKKWRVTSNIGRGYLQKLNNCTDWKSERLQLHVSSTSLRWWSCCLLYTILTSERKCTEGCAENCSLLNVTCEKMTISFQTFYLLPIHQQPLQKYLMIIYIFNQLKFSLFYYDVTALLFCPRINY